MFHNTSYSGGNKESRKKIACKVLFPHAVLGLGMPVFSTFSKNDKNASHLIHPVKNLRAYLKTQNTVFVNC
jgi:hypothetical protein